MKKNDTITFTKKDITWLSQQLPYKHAAYNVTIINQDGYEEEVQGNFHEDVMEFAQWIQEMINEIDWPVKSGVLQLHKSYKVIDIEFDHYLADEVAEDKKFSSPKWQELPMVTIYVPGANQIVQISEGDGSNLSKEDKENGMVDYINYTQYDLDNITEEYDGGQIDQKECLRDKYSSLVEVIPEVLEFAYGDATVFYIILAS